MVPRHRTKQSQVPQEVPLAKVPKSRKEEVARRTAAARSQPAWQPSAPQPCRLPGPRLTLSTFAARRLVTVATQPHVPASPGRASGSRLRGAPPRPRCRGPGAADRRRDGRRRARRRVAGRAAEALQLAPGQGGGPGQAACHPPGAGLATEEGHTRHTVAGTVQRAERPNWTTTRTGSDARADAWLPPPPPCQYAATIVAAGQAGKSLAVSKSLSSARKPFRFFKPVESLAPLLTGPAGPLTPLAVTAKARRRARARTHTAGCERRARPVGPRAATLTLFHPPIRPPLTQL